MSEVSVYSDRVKECIEAIPQEVADMPEEALRRKVDPNISLYKIKRAFWEEIAKAQDKGRKMQVVRVFERTMQKETFYRLIQDPYKLAWIMHPVTTYENTTQAALDKVQERYEELISMDIQTTKRIKDEDAENGYRIVTETDPKKALVLLQVIRNLEDRIKGTAIQRQVSVHTDRPKNSDGSGSGAVNMDAVNERLKELEHKLGGDNGGFTERDSLASGHEVPSDGETGGVDEDINEFGGSSDDGQRGEVVSKKTIEVERGNYREIDS